MTDAVIQQSTAQSVALERVMHRVLDMKAAGDIDLLVGEVWDVLEKLDFDFLSYSFLLVDEKRDWLTSYNIWQEQTLATIYSARESRHVQRLPGGLIIFSGQTALTAAPSLYQEAIAAWRGKSVERHLLSATEIEEMTRMNSQRYGPIAPGSYPVRFHLHVPFAHGVFTLRSDRLETDQFSDLQIDFLQRLVNTISVGYARWRELLRLERDRTVQRMRAEVQAMQQGDDIIDLMGLLWEELHRVGLDFHYVSITVGDEGDDDVHLYMVWHRKFRDTVAAPYTLLRADITPTADVYYKRIPRRIWNEYHTEFTGVRQFTNEEVPAYVERTIRMWRAGEAGDGRPATPVHAWVLMAAHLPQGRIVLAQFQEAPESPAASFTPEDLEILEAFAEALGLGFTRFFDFQRLERHNRDLEIQQSVDRLRAEVASMRQSSHIADVAVLLGKQLNDLGVEYSTSSFSVIDEEAGLVRFYALGPSEWINAGLFGGTHTVADRAIIGELADVEGPALIEDILPGFHFFYTAEDLANSPIPAQRDRPPRLIHRSEEDAKQELFALQAPLGIGLPPGTAPAVGHPRALLARQHRHPPLRSRPFHPARRRSGGRPRRRHLLGIYPFPRFSAAGATPPRTGDRAGGGAGADRGAEHEVQRIGGREGK